MSTEEHDSGASPPEDTQLIPRILAGERDLFRDLIAMHRQTVYSIILRQVGDIQTAEDLAQETFVKAYLNLRHFQFRSKFSSWLIRIALNHTNSYFTSKRYKRDRRTDPYDLSLHQQSTPGMDQTLERKEFFQHFRDALAALKAVHRDVLVLCGLDGKSYEEVAELLEIPVGTVRSRLNKARLLMKKAIGDDRLRSLRHES